MRFWKCWPSSYSVWTIHIQYLAWHVLARGLGVCPWKILKISTPEIESESSIDGKLWTCKIHGGWLATPSTPWINPWSTKATAYISLVQPILEYASSVWDPYQYNKIYIILLIEYSIEQLAGHRVIMRDIVVQYSCSNSSIGKPIATLENCYYTKFFTIILHVRYTTLLYSKPF